MFGLTQKKVIDFHKNAKITVMSFNAETGRRELTYGGANPTSALDEAMRQSSLGRKVVFLDTLNRTKLHQIEYSSKRKGRITYEEALPYAVSSLKSI